MLDDDHPQTYLHDAIKWIRQRGGIDACARDALKASGGSKDLRQIYRKLREVGAPVGVYGLLSKALYKLTHQ